MNSLPHIVVIGAGIAGLSCATVLQQAGLKVSVFDKSRGAAGRMSTCREGDWQCDHGAQYFTARHPEFRAEVARWQQAGVAGPWLPRLKVVGGTSNHQPDPAVERFVGIPRMTAPGRLLAVPAPQALPLLKDVAPEMATVAASATMRGCWALMLRFTAPVGLPFDAAFVNEGPLRWISRDNSKPGRAGPETWLLHASAEWSEAHLEQSADSVAETLLKAFKQLGGPAPQAWTAHRWRYADTEPVLNRGCVWDAGVGLGLCGDWLNGGKVEGAWLSGRRLAQQVLESLSP